MAKRQPRACINCLGQWWWLSEEIDNWDIFENGKGAAIAMRGRARTRTYMCTLFRSAPNRQYDCILGKVWGTTPRAALSNLERAYRALVQAVVEGEE